MPESGIKIRNATGTGLREKMLNRPDGGLFKIPIHDFIIIFFLFRGMKG
jgi:hypothetical protein